MIHQPVLRPHPGRNRYEYMQDWTFRGVVIPRGFLYDGASIPPIADRLTHTPFHPDVMAAAGWHDWIFRTHIESIEFANTGFRYILRASGADPVKVRRMYRAVRAFGPMCWGNSEEEDRALYLFRLSVELEGRPNFADYRFPL